MATYILYIYICPRLVNISFYVPFRWDSTCFSHSATIFLRTFKEPSTKERKHALIAQRQKSRFYFIQQRIYVCFNNIQIEL